MFKDQIELIDWTERDYEEVLIERVKNRHDHKRHIRLAVDFQPTPRRLQRIRKLLEKVSDFGQFFVVTCPRKRFS